MDGVPGSVPTDLPIRSATAPADFSAFMAEAEPRVRRALVGLAGPEVAGDATAEAFAYAWRHWNRIGPMANPAGYVYRVARSRVGRIQRRRPVFGPGPATSAPHADPGGRAEAPLVEPALAALLAGLPERQRVCTFLVHGCQWHYGEVGELLGLSASSVRTHCDRGLAALRRGLKVEP